MPRIGTKKRASSDRVTADGKPTIVEYFRIAYYSAVAIPSSAVLRT
jgi:hypothetical protein